MRFTRSVITTASALVLSLLLSVALIGCAKPADPVSLVAATVNGTEISEADVTVRIESFRLDQTTGEPRDDVAWAQLLKNANFTPETIREFVIRNQFAIFTLILQRAEAAGITPDAAQIDQEIEDSKKSIEGSDGTYEDYLKSMGYASEAAYRTELEARNVSQQLVESQVADATPTQEEIETYVVENASPYAGKRVSVIYLPFDAPAAEDTGTEGEGAADAGDGTGTEGTGDTGDAAAGDAGTEGAGDGTADAGDGDAAVETSANTADVVRPKADEALAKLREGTDFDEVAKEYSQAANAQTDGGDLGWGAAQTLPVDVQAALDALPVNEISEVLETNFGDETTPQYAFMIVKWTEEFVLPDATPATEGEGGTEGEDAPEAEAATEGEGEAGTEGGAEGDVTTTPEPTIDFASVPTSLVEKLTETFVSQKKSEAQQTYFDDLVNSDEVVINPMPEGLSYAVDMALADTAGDEGTETDTGELVKTDIVVGTGPEAKEGDEVMVHYTGYLEDGTVFDSSVERGEPYPVTIGAGQVIQGWDQGLPGMRVGGSRQLVIPPSLAYGEAGQGSIPANATLTFDIELLSVNGDSTGAEGEGADAGADAGEGAAEGEGDAGTDAGAEGADAGAAGAGE
jgi:FKBP-type peptidyl-prolyl cis-trans isomerase/parvulin-like peptidyl-prolyl isomerase